MKIKCPWCGKEKVSFSKKKTLEPHLTPGQQRCVGIGQTAQTVIALRTNMDRRNRRPG